MPNVGYAALQVIPSLRGIEDMLRQQLVGPAGDAGDQAGAAAGSGFKDKLKTGVAAAAVAAGAALVAGLNEAIEQANVSSKLQAQLGTSNKVAAKHGKIAGRLFTSGVTDTFEDGAASIRVTMTSGLLPPGATNKQIESISAKVTDLSTVFDADLGQAANAAGQLMKSGLAKNATEAIDLITKGFQTMGPRADDLIDTTNEYAGQFQKLGLSGKEAFGLLSQGMKAGARDTDFVADALKEFSIRAVDGSKTSAEGFKALGLNARDVTAQIASGGKGASAGLQTVLDRLRAMKDPVAREAAAVALFGTKAEDLGKSLFALDPSKAEQALGRVEGASKKVGETIRSGPGHELTVFRRTLQQGFVEFLGGKVLPIITEFGQFLNTRVRPPLMFIGSILAAVLVPTLTGLWNIGRSVVDWVREFGVWLIPLAIAIGGVTLALNASAIATSFVTLVFSIYRAAILVGTAVTNGFAAAQALLNAVMHLNPITLIVIALIALGAALFIAWKKSDTFRAIVTAMWNGIKTAALFVWNTVLKPIFMGLWAVLQAVGKTALWLWQNAILPAFKGIWLVARILFAIVATLILIPLIAVIKLVGFVAMNLWKYFIQPAFKAIGAIFKWLWNTIAKPILNLFLGHIRMLAAAARWFYNSVIKPVFNLIRNIITTWWAAVRIIFRAVVNFLRGTLGGAFRWLYDHVIKPIWSGIKATISGAWHKGIKPIFELLKAGVNAVRDGFKKGVEGIGKIWNGLKSVARKPVQFVVDTVYNNGIRRVWNMVAGLVGLKKLDTVKFARGGRTRGGTPGKDSIPSLLMADEYVVQRDSARKVGFGNLEYINRTGQLPGFAAGGRVPGVQRYALGGIVDWLSDKAKKIGGAVISGLDFLTSPGKMWDKATGFLREKIAGMGKGTNWLQAISQMPVKMLTALKDKIVGAAKGLFGGAGGKGAGRALAWAKAQAGKPYIWGGVGPRGFDCSGFLGAIQNVITGSPVFRRMWSTFSFQGSRAPGGWRRGMAAPFRIGITNRGVGHTAGTLLGVNVESRGGQGVVVGRRARGWNHPMFTHHYGYVPSFDSGGQVPPGLQALYNGTRRPEALLTDRQWAAMFALARGRDGGGDTNYIVNARTADITVRDLELLQRKQDARTRAGRPH